MVTRRSALTGAATIASGLVLGYVIDRGSQALMQQYHAQAISDIGTYLKWTTYSGFGALGTWWAFFSEAAKPKPKPEPFVWRDWSQHAGQ